MTTLVPIARPAEALLWAAPLPGESEFVLEDPLALDYIGQQVGYFLLPALSSRSSHAHYFAMVLYGLDLAERALKVHGLPDEDATRRQLFERWERLWALAVLESHHGSLGRGHPDAMRGTRGVTRAWFAGDKPLPRDYPLISRQSELGGLGAYVTPLRDLGLVFPGSLRVTPAATPIVDAFWGEPGTPHMQRFDNWALHVLAPACARIERKFQNYRLATLGERSRLTSILDRRPQQDRLFDAILGSAPPPTLAVTGLVEAATRRGLKHPRAVLVAVLDGRCGPVDPTLRDLLALALAFGDAAVAIRESFDTLYATVTDAGFSSPRARVVADVLTPERLAALRGVASALLAAPGIERLQRLPMHGRAFLRLAEELRGPDANATLDAILAFHRRVQRERTSGDAWITEEAGALRVAQTRYTGHRAEARFPALKLGVVRTLLETTGRLPMSGGEHP